MMPLEVIEPRFLAPGLNPRWSDRLDLLLRMLHVLTVSEHPYAYLVATEPRYIRPRA